MMFILLLGANVVFLITFFLFIENLINPHIRLLERASICCFLLALLAMTAHSIYMLADKVFV